MTPEGTELELSVHAYARDAVEDFLAAADAEKDQLRLAIAESDARARRARASIGMHRVMVSMLLETQRDCAEMREEAELDAAEIVAAAEDEAHAIVDAARREVATRGPQRGPTIDLAAAERAEVE